eukprot:1815809-Rhodomonas_salina.1
MASFSNLGAVFGPLRLFSAAGSEDAAINGRVHGRVLPLMDAFSAKLTCDPDERERDAPEHHVPVLPLQFRHL